MPYAPTNNREFGVAFAGLPGMTIQFVTNFVFQDTTNRRSTKYLH